MILRIYILLSFSICSFLLFSQSESDTLKQVLVTQKSDSIQRLTVINSTVPHYILNEEKLVELGAEDIGDALKYIPGTYIKNYGGIGGIKTISYRGLSSTHSSISIDNNQFPNTQTGSINLNNFDIFNISQVKMTSGQIQDEYASASAYLKSNTLSIITNFHQNTKETTSFKFFSSISSINSFQNSILLTHKLSPQIKIGIQANYQFGSGAYPFSINNIDSTFSSSRKDSEYNNFQTKIGFSHFGLKTNTFLSFEYNDVSQKLPGAIVLYNPYSNQDLFNKTIRSSLNHQIKLKKISIGLNGFFQKNNQEYVDHLFLNQAGELRNNYKKQTFGSGIKINYFFTNINEKIFYATDIIYSKLNGSQFHVNPSRTNISQVIGISKWFWRIKFQSNLSHQFIVDNIENSKTNFNHLSPFISASIQPFKKINLRIRAHYKNTYRMPTFNDLFYNLIGNLNLKPENNQSYNLGTAYGFKNKKGLTLELTFDLYQNNTIDKIIAIPTKNLFNWSIQNIGESRSRGIDFNLLFSKKVNKLFFTFSVGQSINSSIDLTNPLNGNYGHQIPYIPKYTGIYNVNTKLNKSSLTLNILHSGIRYSLKENINQNVLPSFTDFGININHNIKINKHHLRLSLVANNILNKNYSIIKSFPMPGRHYLFKLNYSINR